MTFLRYSFRQFAASAHWIALFSSILIGPGALLLSGYDRWDGIHGRYAIESGNLDGLAPWLIDSSWVLLWLLMQGYARLLHWLSADYWVTSRTLLAVLLLWLGWQTGRLAQELFGLDRREACWAAALCLAFPGNVLYHASCHLGIALFAPLGLWAYRLLLRGGITRTALGTVLAAASLQLNALLVLLPCLELARWVLQGRSDAQGQRRLLLLLSLSVLAYVFYRHIIGNHGLSAESNYNEIMWPTSKEKISRLIGGVAAWGTWLLLPAAGILPAFVWLSVMNWGASCANISTCTRVTEWRKVQAAFLIYGAAAGVYLAVGKYVAFLVPTALAPANSMYSTFIREFYPDSWFFSGVNAPVIRHTIFLAPALGIGAVTTCRWLARRYALISGMVLMLATTWMHTASWAVWGHYEKLVQGALDLSLINGLRTTVAPPAGLNVVLERHQKQRTWYDAETNLMLWDAFGSTKWMSTTVYATDGPTYRKAMSNLNQYRALLARPNSAPFRHMYVASDYTDSGRFRYYVVEPVPPNWLDLLWYAPFTPRMIPPARVVCRSGC